METSYEQGPALLTRGGDLRHIGGSGSIPLGEVAEAGCQHCNSSDLLAINCPLSMCILCFIWTAKFHICIDLGR